MAKLKIFVLIFRISKANSMNLGDPFEEKKHFWENLQNK